ncbi:hypothetical protein BC749_103144 [Flavobacterium araucananum]|nr:hypothetical protein BC749_103144 [Flavobacterium araucananum]
MMLGKWHADETDSQAKTRMDAGFLSLRGVLIAEKWHADDTDSQAKTRMDADFYFFI